MAKEANHPAANGSVSCCIAGGGPAGMMLGFLLARAGVNVVILEKHADFLRDFRGDTIHPSTLELMHELGLLADFLARPHQEVTQLRGKVGGTEVVVGDFSHLPTHCRFVAFMPQWDFLNFLLEHGRRYPTFHVRMQAEVTGLIEEGDRIVGVSVTTPDGQSEIRADLVVGADGRHSTVRARGGLQVEGQGVPIDVLWMRFSRRAGDANNPLGHFDRGRVFVMLDRGDYWQCAFIIPKGKFDEIQSRGLDVFRADIAQIAPSISDRVGELRSWDDVSLLTVVVDHLRRWYRPGLLCIGDAAHAMSPIGGVGINLAIQDAVAAANILSQPLRNRTLTIDDLQNVQRRREFPARLTQRIQIFIQDRIIYRVLAGKDQLTLPWQLRLLRRFPILRRIPARLVGIGFRPEHIKTKDVFGPALHRVP
jgi:2-polyprenyl-6-methoxyphenol hydroxylase-like FAD-dependent oxidoreductase